MIFYLKFKVQWKVCTLITINFKNVVCIESKHTQNYTFNDEKNTK